MADTFIEVPAELFAPAESSHFEGEIDLGQIVCGPDTYTFENPVSWSVEVSNTGDQLLVMGTAQGKATTACARCLEDFSLNLVGEIEGCFIIDPSKTPEGLDEDEFEPLPEDLRIDVEPLVKAALLLELPLVPLCDENCAGLCPHCGANLNEGPCGCEERPAEDDVPRMSDGRPSPFAALKDFPFSEN